ncbi:hypothetical protein ThvES_00001780 [Thiovulum sp. ES]|nr:hypothetical protein ThvES_00001780 [Thiovulum sp. ES]
MRDGISDDAIKVQMVKNILDLANSETSEEDREFALRMLRKYSNLSMKYIKENAYYEIAFINFVSKVTDDHELEAQTMQKISEMFTTKSFTKERDEELKNIFRKILSEFGEEYKEKYENTPNAEKPIPDVLQVIMDYIVENNLEPTLAKDIGHYFHNMMVEVVVDDTFEDFKNKNLLEQLQTLDIKLRAMGVDIDAGREEIEEIMENEV